MKPIRNHVCEQGAMNFTVKNIPDEIFKKIRLRAAQNRRSMNSEIIEILAGVTMARRPTVQEILARADELRSHTKGVVTDEFLSRAKREGRP